MNKEVTKLIEESLAKDKKSSPRGWIQWKGTDVCIDIHCSCGCLSHYDGDFMYSIICLKCKQAYIVGQNVALYPLSIEQVELITSEWIEPKLSTT